MFSLFFGPIQLKEKECKEKPSVCLKLLTSQKKKPPDVTGNCKSDCYVSAGTFLGWLMMFDDADLTLNAQIWSMTSLASSLRWKYGP